MDQRRAAGALLALAVCIASTAAAPTASNQTALDLYDGSAEGCYYNFQHYGEGDRIMTNEPCLNCTCHNRMLMCYLRVCPFTKPIGQDCTVEKRADQCCPIVTCPDVPVDLLTSTSTTSPAEYGATGVGKLDKYGCSIHGKYFPEGSKVPPTPNKPCEHCYCIRNMTTCVMQECTLHVDGCTPIYHKDVCCPVRYSCDHPEDTTLLLDDMTTTVRPTPGFLLTTTTLSPVTQMSQDCVHDDKIFSDGALIKTEKACEHCYCMKGDIVCVVQECGTPMENEGKNCTSQPPREGQCCPDTYICEGDEVTTEPPSDYSTKSQLEELTTISPPRRVGVEGSGYRNEPDEPVYTESPLMETEPEGSGYEQSTEPAAIDDSNLLTSEAPEISSEPIDDSVYSSRTTVRTPTLEEVEKTTEPDKGLNTVPSDASDEEIYKPAITEKSPFEEPKVTETILTTSPEGALLSEVTTKHEESTTESAFRKEDTLGETTELYDQGKPEKDFTLGTDIEKETEDDVTSSTTKAPFIEELEKQTTLSPEFTQKDIEQGIPSKESMTESTLEVTTSVDVKPTDILTTDSEEVSQTETTQPTVEKVDVHETTGSELNEIEDTSTTLSPGRIPGEGDCLLNDVTYRNNSNVPSSNNCHTSCRCVSSIIKCDPIICSPPPEYMDNCQPTYDSADSCCPTYVCHTGETMPPQPHSQMSGTDSPLPSSPIECHGGECEVRKDDNVPVVGDCGSAGCSDGHSGIPEKPSDDCHNGKCSLPVQPCTDGNCQETLATHCENGKCGIEHEIPVKNIPLCENESECKETVPENTSCDGEECVKVNVECSGTDCSTDVVKQPCIDGNCPETPAAHCENGKCDIEPQIIPVKDIPLCENESDCKGTIPEVPLCEGEGCVSVNVECSGTDCSLDVTKQPVIPGQKEGSCEGDCKTTEDKTIEPCTETSCRRKETGEVDSSLPSDCLGSDCIQQLPSKELSTKLPVPDDTGIKSTQQLEITTVRQEITTESPELQTKVSEDTSEHQPTEAIILALDERSTTVPLPQATRAPSEEKVFETVPSSQFDHTTESQLEQEDTATKSPQMVEEDLSTSEPHISVTDETRISDTDVITKEPQTMATKEQEEGDIQSPVTESQDITTKVDLEESHQSETTQHILQSPTEAPHDTELHDIRTAVPQESSTSIPETEDTKTESLDHHEELSTKAPEQEQTESSIPHVPDEDVNKYTEEPLPYTPEIDMTSTKLPQTNVEPDVTEQHVTEVINVSSHDATESNEISEKATKAPETVDTDKYKTTTEIFLHELTTEGALLDTESQEPEIVTKISEATTAKVSEDASDVTSKTPEIYKTEKQESFTDYPKEFTGSQELITKQPFMPGQETGQTESPEFTTDETIGQPEVSVSAEDTKSQTTSATPVTDSKVKVTLPSDTTITDEGTTPASLLEEKTTISELAEKPEGHDDEKEQPTESPDTNEITQDIAQEPSEKPITPSILQEDQHAEELDSKITKPDKTVTEKSDTFLTEQPSIIPEDYYKPEQVTEPEQKITDQQEISTEEPFISPVTDKIPSKPYIPVQQETTYESATEQPDIINVIPDVEPGTQTPATNDDVETETKIPDRSGLNEATEVSEHMDTESPYVKVPETATEVEATQPPELFSETPKIEDVHKDEQPQSTETPTSDILEDTKEKMATEEPEIFSTKRPAVDEVPEMTPSPEIPEEQEKESVTTERIIKQPSEGEQEETSKPDKYSTLSVIQETTVASVELKDIAKQTTESEVTESGTPLYATSAPESHVKEPQEPVTETSDTFTTESHDIGVSVPQEKLSPEKTITEGPQEVSSVVPEEKPAEETPDIPHDKKPEEKLESPQDTYTKTPDETSTVLLEVATEATQTVIPMEPTQEVVSVKPQVSDTELQEEEKTPEEKSTEKPDNEGTSILPDEFSTGSSMGLDTAVTEPTQYKVTEAHIEEVTSTVSTDEQENITFDDSQEKMTTVLQESPKQPPESSTRIPQDITLSETDLEQRDKYTVDISQETTPVVLPDVVTDAPKRQETGKPEGEGVEMHLTTLKTPQTDVVETSPEQVTVGFEQATEEPTVHETQEPDDAEKEIMTDAPVLSTQETTADKQTMPDVVELVEHSHKPVEDISTIATTEEGIIPDLSQEHDEEKQKPQVTTEKQTLVTEIDEEKVSIPSDEFGPEITMVTTIDLGEIPKSTLPPSNEKDDQYTDVPTTSQSGIQAGDQRFDDDTSPKDQQPTQPSSIPDTEIPVQTEKVLTDKVPESELSHETTMLVELGPVTTQATAEKETEEGLTQKPEYGKPLEEIPQEKPIEKPQEEPDEKPLEEPTEKPMVEPEQKPLDETEPTEKPANEPEVKPSETPLEEPTMTPLAAEEPQVEDEDKLIKPLDQAEEKPTETPEEKLEEEAEEKPTETPEFKPLEEPTELLQEKPLKEVEDKSTEKPLEESDKMPEKKPEEKPLDELERISTEKPEQEPLGPPEEKPQEFPEGEPQQVPEEKPLKEPEEKPQDVSDDTKPLELPEEKPQEQPEEKPLKATEEKPLETPEEKPQEIPEEKPQTVPEEKPVDVSEAKPQEMPGEKQQEVPEETPAVAEEKPDVPEGKPQELPEEQPQKIPDETTEMPEEKPQELPEEKPQEVPEQKPEIPEDKLQEVPEQKPEGPKQKPQELPEGKPQELPEEKPQELPEKKPQELPEEKPEVPTEQPQEMLEEKPEVPEKTPQEIPAGKPEEPEEKPQDVPKETPQELPEPEAPTEIPQELPEEKPQEVPKEKPQEVPEEKPEEHPHELPEPKPQEEPEEKPAEPASTASPEISKPGFGDTQPTDEVPDDDNQFPPSGGTSGYGTEHDYVEEDQAFGPGTCRYGGKVYVSAQQIPRDDPCDFCFCFRSDIICLQQSCPPPIHGCHEEPIQGFCCPRYECPVAMATTLNVTTTTTTTTTTLPPHFLPHAYKGAAQRRGCQIKGHTYKVGEVVRASSGPCLHCTCGGDGQMKCDPKACTPEPMLRQMIAAAVSAKRRR